MVSLTSLTGATDGVGTLAAEHTLAADSSHAPSAVTGALDLNLNISTF